MACFSSRYASLSWSADDVLAERPHWSRDDAERWMASHEVFVRDAMLASGKRALREMLDLLTRVRRDSPPGLYAVDMVQTGHEPTELAEFRILHDGRVEIATNDGYELAAFITRGESLEGVARMVADEVARDDHANGRVTEYDSDEAIAVRFIRP